MKRTSSRKRRNPSPETLKSKVSKIYTALHEGQPPSRFVTDPPVKQPKYLVSLGRIPEFVYYKQTTDGEHAYKHDVELPADQQPVLAHDERGKLHIVQQQHVHVTEHGIEDKMAHRRGIMRANPGKPMQGAVKVGKTLLVGGAVGAVGLIATGMAMEKLAPATLNTYVSALIKAGVAVGGAIGLDYAGQETAAAGFGIAVMAAAVLQAYDAARLQFMPASAGVYLPQGQAYTPAQGYYSYAS